MPTKQAESSGFLFVNVSKASGADKKSASIPSAGRAFVRRNEWSSRRIHLRDTQIQLSKRPFPATVAGSEANDARKGGRASRPQKGPTLCAEPTSIPSSQECKSICANGGHHQTLLHNFHRHQALTCISCEDGLPLVYNSQTLLTSYLNPFGDVSRVLGPEGPTILRYYTTFIMPRTTRVRPSFENPPTIEHKKWNQWMELLLNTPALLHASFCLAALQLSVSNPTSVRGAAGIAAHHRLEAIRAIQVRLADPATATSDGNIAAVFSLICFERNIYNLMEPGDELRPSSSQIQAHRNGLNQMIAIRGGIEGMSTSRMLQSLLARHTATEMVGPSPYTCITPSSLVVHLPENYPASSQFFNSPGTVLRRFQEAGVDKKLVRFAQCAECLLRDTRAWAGTPDNYQMTMSEIDYIHLGLMGAILRWHMDAEESGKLTPAEGLLSIAVSHSIALNYRDSWLISNICRTPIMQWIIKHLSDFNVMEVLYHEKLDIWVAFMLLTYTCGFDHIEEQIWVIWHAAITKRKEYILNFQDLMNILEDGLWDPTFEVFARFIWIETQLHRMLWNQKQDFRAAVIKSSRKLLRLIASVVVSDPYHNSSSRRDLTVF